MAKTTFWDIIERTIEKVGTPLSPKEIWEKANEEGTLGDFSTTGKTPWSTIGAYCYTDIQRAGDKSTIIQTSERPAQFFLRKLVSNTDLEKIQKQKENETLKKEKVELKKLHERDLHTIFAAYVYADTHFKANVKTIYHEISQKNNKGQNEWLHPDLVGVYFPFREYKSETLDIQDKLSAVSNSSWANEGYLVTLALDEDPIFRDEMRRLNNAFGIGVIKLNAENIFESEILFPAKIKTEIDWDTVNRLATENSDFSTFLKLITEDCKLGKVKSEYDKVLKIEEVFNYMKDKGIRDVV